MNLPKNKNCSKLKFRTVLKIETIAYTEMLVILFSYLPTSDVLFVEKITVEFLNKIPCENELTKVLSNRDFALKGIMTKNKISINNCL